MQIFLQVLESGNFTRAAQALGLPRSTVSTEIQLVEDRLQAQLFLRTTRKVVPTQDGRRFAESARDILDAVTASEQMFRHADLHLSGRLRVDVPSRIGRRLILPALPDFLDRHPGLSVDLSASDRIVDLVADGVDCALRVGSLENSELVSRNLGMLRFVTCASPAYVARHGLPRAPGALATHRLVNYATRLPAMSAELEITENGQARPVSMASTITVDGAEAYLAAALSGLGLIQVPAYDVADLIASGRLVEILPAHPPPPVPLSFLFVRRRNLSPRVRLFQDWITALLNRHGLFDA
ncbi:LysR family transcriptional regulator [Paracoccus sp. DMF-8]|uniref:LysR family transcriptional regulator n=1 Tax=Paracoccus sp. DMF-8 TaxID=3019445 RepID=UPI0023E7B280|nr:LysR family transcriptional regulator [Paracoccus sp. DMF-8]MDF3605379.1 LysR family transcriptional regulator [Paracoccus sp. DMF-8]